MQNKPKPKRKSYYKMSRVFPTGKTGFSYAIGESRTLLLKEKRQRRIFAVFLAFVFIISIFSFLVINKITEKPIDDGGKLSQGESIKALYMSRTVFYGDTSLDIFKAELKKHACNAVMIDYKDENGYIYFNSQNKTAAQIGAFERYNPNDEKILEDFKNEGYKIIARVCCFADPLAASHISGAPVLDKKGNIWLSDSAINGGSSYLDPYSKEAKKYLKSIIGDVARTKPDMIFLDKIGFPDGKNIENAAFAGELGGTSTRYQTLSDFVKEIRSETAGIKLGVLMTAGQAVNGSDAFGGSLFDSGADFSVVDFRAKNHKKGEKFGDYTVNENSETPQIASAASIMLSKKLKKNYETKKMAGLYDTAKAIDFGAMGEIRDIILVNGENELK